MPLNEATIGEYFAAVLRGRQPPRAIAVKSSIEFATANSLVTGRVTLRELQDEFVLQPLGRRL